MERVTILLAAICNVKKIVGNFYYALFKSQNYLRTYST